MLNKFRIPLQKNYSMRHCFRQFSLFLPECRKNGISEFPQKNEKQKEKQIELLKKGCLVAQSTYILASHPAALGLNPGSAEIFSLNFLVCEQY